jgi:urease accessory protein UreE
MRIFRAPPIAVVEALPAPVGPAGLLGKEADRLLLTWEQRRWIRGRFTTEAGRAVALALPTGTPVEPGQILWIDADWYLTMEAALEPLLVVHTRDRQQEILAAFEVGNLHFPLALDGSNLLVPDDSAMIHLLDRMGIQWERHNAPFQPIGKGQRHEY